jgi:hypothetical protein
MGRSSFHNFAQCTLPLSDLTANGGSSSIAGLDIDWGDGSSDSVYGTFPTSPVTDDGQPAAGTLVNVGLSKFETRRGIFLHRSLEPQPQPRCGFVLVGRTRHDRQLTGTRTVGLATQSQCGRRGRISVAGKRFGTDPNTDKLHRNCRSRSPVGARMGMSRIMHSCE